MPNYKIIILNLLLILNTVVLNAYTQEFLYPVAYAKESNIIYVIHQKELFSVELWAWDLNYNNFNKALLSNFLPGGFKLLPGNNSFSFIDQGRLRIKNQSKRSHKSLEFDNPIYDIGPIEWIDDKNCIFSAKNNNHNSIFTVDITAPTKQPVCIRSDRSGDCFYPQKIGKDLFYIKKANDNKYYIVNTDDLTFQDTAKDKVLLAVDSPCAFLHMISDREGFFMAHPSCIDRMEELMQLSYCMLHKENNLWKCTELLSLSLPFALIFGKNNERLYESILPFLPRYHDKKIIFCSCSDIKNLTIDIYCYDLLKKTIIKMTSAKPGQKFLSPVAVGSKIFYGGMVNKLEDNLLDKSQNSSFPVNSLPFFEISS